MLDLFENFHKYIPDDKFDSIIACIKEEKEESAISAILKTFMNEYVHISTQLNKISYFDKNVFKKININDIDKVLEDMKFEKSIFNFFSSDGFYEIVDEVNNSIEELRKEAIDIKVAMGKLQSVLKQTVATSQKDINNFLESAGITYQVGINLDENGQAIATLQYIHNKKLVQVDKIRKHLSWGERNAFSLVLFMFYAISENAKLIVLDDPISSFYVNNSEMPQAEIQKGCTEIKKWIQNFDYDELYRNVYNEEKLAELYFAETNDYLKIQLFRALFEVNPSREIKEEDVLVKFINESYHIENDYAYYLDMVKFETVPEYIVKAIDDYMERTYSNV